MDYFHSILDVEDLDIDLSKSWLVGDATRDVQAGRQAGCRTVVLTDSEQTLKGGNQPADVGQSDFAAENLLAATDIIIDADMGPASLEQTAPKEGKTVGAAQDENTKVLNDILREMRHQRVAHRHLEFPVSKMLAGMLQCVVFLCLVLIYVALNNWSDRALLVCLGIALILQTMVVALLLSHRSS